MNNLRFMYAVIMSVGIFLTGLVLIFFDSFWSIRQRQEIYFLQSPWKEIFGMLCVCWGVWFFIVSTKVWKNNFKKKKEQ